LRDARFRYVVFRSGGGSCLAPPGRAINLAPLRLPAAEQQTVLPRPDDAPGPPLPPAEGNFIEWVFRSAGLDVHVYRIDTLRRRLPACLRGLRADSVAQARQRLEQEPGLIALALGTMVLGVSGFFRDAGVFADLREHVLPALPRRAGHPRVWSVGCSDGQELYSVAMLLGEAGALGGATLLGTDCRSAAVARARDGRYEEARVHDVPRDLFHKYFVRDCGGWRVCDAIRAAVHWRSGDATQVIEPGGWDLILCRNVSMYLRTPAASRLRLSCEQALRPGGVLVLGKAERPVGPTRLTLLAPCIYRKE
jgi:chemotaxis methyl-accepting protein methylase